MNPFQKLLQSISGSGIQRAAGLIDTLGAPSAAGLIDTLGAPIQRSVGNIRDILEKARPNSKGQQQLSKLIERPINFSRSLSPLVIKTKFEDPVQRFLQEYGNKLPPGVTDTAASLKPTSAPTAFPFDDPLTLLKGQARYAQRQIQGGIGQVGNLYKKLPTAINPFATRTPTTRLGKAGSIFNPFNPVNAAGYVGAAVLDAAMPDNTKRDNESYNLGLLTLAPGIPGKMAALGLLGTTVNAFDEDALIRQLNASDRIGKNYTVNGIQYDYETGRPVNPRYRQSSDRSAAPPVDSGFTQAGTLNTGIGSPDQRRIIEERNYQTQLSNAKQQYATPDPMSSDFQGYPNELAAQYGLEQSYGQELKQAGTLVPQLQEAGAGAGMTPENFAAWAKANPGLAVRLLSQGQRN